MKLYNNVKKEISEKKKKKKVLAGRTRVEEEERVNLSMGDGMDDGTRWGEDGMRDEG